MRQIQSAFFLWERGILDKMFDQFKLKSDGGDRLSSFQDWDRLLADVHNELCYDLEVIAINIFRDPGWRPRARSENGDTQSDQTASLLSMSLVGATTP